MEHLLTAVIFLPLLGAFALIFIPRESTRALRYMALARPSPAWRSRWSCPATSIPPSPASNSPNRPPGSASAPSG